MILLLFLFVSKKIHDNLNIFLNKNSRDLYQKYKDVSTKNGLLFPFFVPLERRQMESGTLLVLLFDP